MPDHPVMSPASSRAIPEHLASYQAKFAELSQLAEHAGPEKARAVAAAVAPHLPQMLALAKTGNLNSHQLAQLRTLVGIMLKEYGNRVQNELEQPAQGTTDTQVSVPNKLPV
ncbi:hypothetical protein AG1IA_06913 [Rhizoctonia solani AG-1 IA]|uniref:Uncharacterized protein n=1 Tax=Thanatephorus cucumeris (strain AG1-IA) TaxID=983506 RepID=L8WLK4_THACA|nr:hypothetical protein AG1IA_06913 [Rhizoctonia solani AG-1 IA]